MNKIILILFFCFIILHYLNGNGTTFEIINEPKIGSLTPIKSNSIIMTKEKIEITFKIDRVIEDYYHIQNIKYKCIYYFKNTTNEKLNILMGYPVKYMDTYEQVDGGIGESEFYNSYIENESFKITSSENILDSKKYPFKENKKLLDLSNYDAVYGFFIDFNSNEEKKIICEHSFSFYAYSYKIPLQYILTSNKAFKSPIDDCSISIYFNIASDLIDIKKSNYKFKKKDTLLAQFDMNRNNFRPKQDIEIDFIINNPMDYTDELIKKKNDNLVEFKDFIYSTYWLASKYPKYGQNVTDSQRKFISWINYKYGEIYFDDYIKQWDHFLINSFRKSLTFSNHPSIKKIVDESMNMNRDYSIYIDYDLILNIKNIKNSFEKQNEYPSYFSAYNLAKIYSYKNNKKFAIGWLKAALKLGYPNVKLIKSDKLILNTINKFEIRKIINEYSKKN